MKIFYKRIEKNIIRIILGLGILIWFYRLWYFIYSNVPLWYDPGMYKEIFNSYVKVLQHLDFSLLPNWVRHEPLLWIITALLHKTWISFDRLITRGIWLINLIPWFLLFRFFKSRKNPRLGILSALLYRTSIVQYEIFRWNYFKQTIAVSIMILIIILWEKKKLIAQTILFFLLILLHRHTAIFTLAILSISTLIQRIKTKNFPRKQVIYRFIAGIIALLIYIPIRNRVMPEAIKAVSNSFWSQTMWWDFMNIISYIKLQRSIIILSIIWLFVQIKNKKFDMWMIWYWISIIWIIVHLVNFNRTIVFLDIFVIVLAAYALIEIIKLSKKFWLKSIWIMFTVLFCLVSTIHYLWYVAKRNIPLISQEEYNAIKNLDIQIEKNAIVMVTHRNYNPWIMWRANRDYINPGMSDTDKRTQENWNHRWLNDGKIKCEMLKQTYEILQRPLYLRLWELQFIENLDWWDCFKLVRQWTTRRLYKIY